MFDPDDIAAPDIFGDLGRDAMKVVGPLALLLLAPVLLLIAAFGGLSDAIETSAAPPPRRRSRRTDRHPDWATTRLTG